MKRSKAVDAKNDATYILRLDSSEMGLEPPEGDPVFCSLRAFVI
ncbi:MAG: hypothetical protein AAGA03_04405 [Planctomycetota bacterium]